MSKLKTRKSISKRFKVTGTGKLVHRSVALNHLMRKKSKGERRRLIKGTVLVGGDAKRVARMLGMAQ